MKIHVPTEAARLKIVDVFKPGNPSGHVTNPKLYDRSAPGNNAPAVKPYMGWINHITVGTNSLPFLTQGTVGGNWACIPYLVPRGDNPTVYKLIPDDHRGHHAGVASFMGISDFSSQFSGVEIENLGNGKQEVDQWQYVKVALLYAYFSAKFKTDDRWCLSHSLIASPHGRRSDPEAGFFRYSVFWDLVAQIRRDWPQLWSMPVWWGKGIAD